MGSNTLASLPHPIVLSSLQDPAPPLRNLARRQFLGALATCLAGVASGCKLPSRSAHPQPRERLFFVSNGRTWMIASDGSGLREFDFKIPNQVTWQPGPMFPDGRRVVFLSMEERRDGPGRPFDQYYTLTPTHLWSYDLATGRLDEIANRDRLAVFYTPALLIGSDRLLVQVVRNRVGQIFNMALDGSDAREFTRAGEGLPYGLSLSPDGRRVAYHLASPKGYQVWTSDTEGRNRTLVAAHPDHLYFGPAWSPQGDWLAFLDCEFKTDPAHDWADVVLARPDGSERRPVTSGQAVWFGAAYGNLVRRASGSNLPSWTQQGRLLLSRRMPHSRVAWEFQPQRPDTDHFNRDYKPASARGGVYLAAVDPLTGDAQILTEPTEGRWDFRASESASGGLIAFVRTSTTGHPCVWSLEPSRNRLRNLTCGSDQLGADHPRWIPTPRA